MCHDADERFVYDVTQVIYENMLTELPFASFFLSKLLSRQKGNVDIHHLASLDPVMYKWVRMIVYNRTFEQVVPDEGEKMINCQVSRVTRGKIKSQVLFKSREK